MRLVFSCFLFLFLPDDFTALSVNSPAHVVVHELANVNVTCDVTGAGDVVDVWWTREDGRKISQPGNATGSRFLLLRRVARTDGGTFLCHARDRQGDSGNSSTLLDVYFLPRWLRGAPLLFAISAKSPAHVRCSVLANPAVNVTWYGPRGATGLVGDVSYKGGSWYVSEYLVHDVSQIGNYTCVVQNKLGKLSFNVRLQLPGAPDGPRECHVMRTHPRIVSVRCIPGFNGGRSELRFPVQVRALPLGVSSLTYADSRLVEKHDDETHITLDVRSLQPSTNYSLAFYVETELGRSSFAYLVIASTASSSALPTVNPMWQTADKFGRFWSHDIIIGVSVGAFVVLGAVVGGIVYMRCCRKSREAAQNKQNKHEERQLQSASFSSDGSVLANLQSPHGHCNVAYESKPADAVVSWSSQQTECTSFALKPKDDGIGFCNPSYFPEALETSLDAVYAPVHSDANVYTDAMRCAHKASMRQSELIGHGALAFPLLDTLHRDRNVPPDESLSYASWPTMAATADGSAVSSKGGELVVSSKDVKLLRRVGLANCWSELWVARVHGLVPNVVLVKKLASDFTEDEHRLLLREVAILQSLQSHSRIARILGTCSKPPHPPLYITELPDNGNLLDLLRASRVAHADSASRLSTANLLSFCAQIADAMSFVSSRSLLHPDLACRSVRIDCRLNCHLADFGAFEDVNRLRRNERVQAVRWMAPESLFDRRFETASDVWSFGVVLWEIWSLGSTPYPGKTYKQVIDLVGSGFRINKPGFCPDELYCLMRDCWKHSEAHRPAFPDIFQRVGGIHPPDQQIFVDEIRENMYEFVEASSQEKI